MNRRVSGLHPTFQSWIDMPTGPKGETRPRDTNQLAKLMVDILTGEVEDRERTPEERGVDPAASAMGKKGGPAPRLGEHTDEILLDILGLSGGGGKLHDEGIVAGPELSPS